MDPKQSANAIGKNPRPPKVKNKTPAPVQITAEQLLKESHDRRLEPVRSIPQQRIESVEEMAEVTQRTRKEYEDNIRKNRLNMKNWLKYAAWEEGIKAFDRARSVFERALDVDRRDHSIWIRYAEMEMKNRKVNLARNILDRAVTHLPRANQLWYMYVRMEEMLGDVPKARNVYERWMEFEPAEDEWDAYIKMEERYHEIDRASAIYQRFVSIRPEPSNFIKWAKFEEKHGNLKKCRDIFDEAIKFLLEDDKLEQTMIVAYAKFEIRLREYERAQVIFKFGLDRLPKAKSQSLFNQYTNFVKQYGDSEAIENVVLGKRRVQYEEMIESNPKDYDVWFKYARLEESIGDMTRVREVYERAIAEIPPAQEKMYWERYIYLWISYALYEELEAKDVERTRDIYNECLKLIPHKKFTFAKIWLLFAKFEVRQLNLTAARKLLGRAIGLCPKNKLFKGYIELEIQLREFDRCRTLYEKYLHNFANNCAAWIEFAELEQQLEEIERCRAIFEIATDQPVLDMPELLWKAYIDFEIEQEEFEKTRHLYRRLLEKTAHIKVYISFAEFELSISSEHGVAGGEERARSIFKNAYETMKEKQLKDERVILLQKWKEFEENYGTEETLESVLKMMPKQVTRRKRAADSTDENIIWQEYKDWVFPDEAQSGAHKLLEMAHAWQAKQKQATESN